MTRLNQDFWAGILFLIIGTAFAWGATSYSLGRGGQPGPGSFPFALGVLIALLGLALVVKAARAGFTRPLVEAGAGTGEATQWWTGLVVLLAVVLFGAALIPFGLVIAVTVLVLVAKPAVPGLAWGSAVLVAATLALCTSLLFVGLLNLPIPLWPRFDFGF